MKCEIEHIEYESQMPSPFGLSLPRDTMEMHQRTQQPSDVPSFYVQNLQQPHWINSQQKRLPCPQNFQTEPPPLHYNFSPQNVTVQNVRYMHPQFRAMQLQQQQRRHEQMLQQNMINMRMQSQMIQRQRMHPPIVARQPGLRIPIQQQHAPQQWRFHNVRSAVPIVNSNHVATPPPLMPVECQLAETPAPSADNCDMDDDFHDFDVTDLLRLTFGDENENNQRKRRSSSKSSCEDFPSKRYRRTKAELIVARNETLLEQCRDVRIHLDRIDLPDNVRIFGKNILRKNMPNVPNMKLTPKNIDFTRIRNVGYLVTKRGICFSCLTNQCRFKSYDTDKFKEHVIKCHQVEGSGSTEGFCRACAKHCCGYTLLDEVVHILSKHVQSIERHPMHQILYSHIRKPTNQDEIVTIEDDINNILEQIEEIQSNGETARPKSKKSRNGFMNYSDDEDYNPEEIESIEDEEIDSDCEEIMDSDLESEPSELLKSEEEVSLFDGSDSDTDKSNEWEIVDKKLQDENTKTSDSNEESRPEPDEFDEVPLYMLNRIKVHATTKNLQDEPDEQTIANTSIKEVIEEVFGAEQILKSSKQKKSKRRKSHFTRKRKTAEAVQPEMNKFYSTTLVADLPPCRVVLKRLDGTSEPECNEKNVETAIKGKTKQIDVPINIPTPPASENSRDSLPTPPLNKSNERHQNDSVLCVEDSNNNKSLIDSKIDKIEVEKIETETLTESNKTIECDTENIEGIKLNATESSIEANSELEENLNVEDNEEIYAENKENSRSKVDINENEKITNSPTSLKSAQKVTPSKFIKNSRLLRKFHKIDHFFQKLEDENVSKNTSENQRDMIEHQKSLNIPIANTDEIIEIQESPEIITEFKNEIPNQSSENISEIDDDVNSQSETTGLVIHEVESLACIDSENEEAEENDEELTNINELYPWIEIEKSSSLQKSKKCLHILKKELTLFSTFKCMKQTCSFFTCNFEKFKVHINLHNGTQYCSFCLYKTRKSEDLIDHIDSDHKYDRYQCNLCMYRAAEKIYVELHQKRFHSCPSGIVLKSPKQILIKSARHKIREELATTSRMKFVQPYRCKTHGCDKQFYNKDNYKNHLKEELDMPNLSKYNDNINSQLLQIDHTELKTYKEGYYQCLYCEFGSDRNFDIHNHLANHHANRLGFFCRRDNDIDADCIIKTDDNQPESLENQTRIEYIGGSSFKIKLFKGNVDSLTAYDKAVEDQMETNQLATENSNQNLMETNQEINDNLLEPDLLNNSAAIISEIIHIDNF